jgi:hypothetical protein
LPIQQFTHATKFHKESTNQQILCDNITIEQSNDAHAFEGFGGGINNQHPTKVLTANPILIEQVAF